MKDCNWTNNTARYSPTSRVAAFAHQLHDDAFGVFQAAGVGDLDMVTRALDMIETHVKLCRKAMVDDSVETPLRKRRK